jgi:hypothetical protein
MSLATSAHLGLMLSILDSQSGIRCLDADGGNRAEAVLYST